MNHCHVTACLYLGEQLGQAGVQMLVLQLVCAEDSFHLRCSGGLSTESHHPQRGGHHHRRDDDVLNTFLLRHVVVEAARKAHRGQKQFSTCVTRSCLMGEGATLSACLVLNAGVPQLSLNGSVVIFHFSSVTNCLEWSQCVLPTCLDVNVLFYFRPEGQVGAVVRQCGGVAAQLLVLCRGREGQQTKSHNVCHPHPVHSREQQQQPVESAEKRNSALTRLFLPPEQRESNQSDVC